MSKTRKYATNTLEQLLIWPICVDNSYAILSGPLPNVDNSFIVADSRLRNIYQVDATTGATAQLLPFGAATFPVALAYDSTAKLLYWSDIKAHTINGYSLLTNSSTVIYQDPFTAGKYDLIKSRPFKWISL